MASLRMATANKLRHPTTVTARPVVFSTVIVAVTDEPVITVVEGSVNVRLSPAGVVIDVVGRSCLCAAPGRSDALPEPHAIKTAENRTQVVARCQRISGKDATTSSTVPAGSQTPEQRLALRSVEEAPMGMAGGIHARARLSDESATRRH